jgi:V8-like Glu-specific endopeptidase
MTLRRFVFILALIPAAIAQRKEPALYQGPEQRQQKPEAPSRSLALPRPPALRLGPLSQQERSQLGPVGPKRRIGVHREISSLNRGTWTELPDGSAIWRLSIHSDQATALRVEFSNFEIGSGKLWVHSDGSSDGPYTGSGPYDNGEFWSSTIEGEAAVVEYEPADAADRSLPFHIHRISHQSFRVSDTPAGAPVDPAASCNLDVNCYSDWATTKKSVAHIQFEETQGSEQGTFLCSASLVSTRDNSFKPYLLTAGHCIHDEAAARSLQTFWAYESDKCNAGPPTSRGTLNSQNGGHLLAWGTIEQGDYSLVLLPNVPSGVVFSGWDTSDPDVGAPVTGIHHPMGSYKRIAFGSTAPSITVSIGQDPAPAELYHLVGWDTGLTEPGSSGSPLFSAPGVIVGMLTYGPAIPGEELCTIGGAAGYAKFSNAYRFLQPFLENFPFTQLTPSASKVQFTGRNHSIIGSASQPVTLTVEATNNVPWSARADAPWIQLSQNSGTLSASKPATFNITVDPKYFTASDTYISTVTINSGAAPPIYVNVSVTMKLDVSSVVISAVPNPVKQNGGSWTLSLVISETAGASTTITQFKIDGVDYTGSILGFFGSANVPANGTLNGVLHTSGLFTPVTKFFEFYGRDNGSGQTWYRMVPVNFIQ